MSTSVQIAKVNPNTGSMYSFSRNACFGQLNRMGGNNLQGMEVLEWHPSQPGRTGANLRNVCTPRKAFNFINSFGMWKDIFRVTTMNTVAADLQQHPIDAIITGFMSMRDFQMRANGFLFYGSTPLDPKIEFALYSAGIYRNRYNSPFLQAGSVSHGEGGVCGLPHDVDALALYLLVYGTAEEFRGCWAQQCFGHGPNTNGYVRDSSRDADRNTIRRTLPTWNRMSDWLSSWLRTNPEHLQDKLGRLTINRFYNGLSARLTAEPSADDDRKVAIITNAFEELRELYA